MEQLFDDFVYTFNYLLSGVFLSPELSIVWIGQLLLLTLLTSGILFLGRSYVKLFKEIFFIKASQ